MRKLIENADGFVGIMELFPLRALGAMEVEILGQRRYDRLGDQPGRTVLYGTSGSMAIEITVGDEYYVIGDLEPESVRGWTFVFPDVESQVLTAWVTEKRAAVVAVHHLPADAPRPDRYFRNAWKCDQGRLDVDMPKARELHRNALRLQRARRFAELDAEYFKAQERSDLVALHEIASHKQALRDAPQDPRLEAAQTPDELKAVSLPVRR